MNVLITPDPNELIKIQLIRIRNTGGVEMLRGKGVVEFHASPSESSVIMKPKQNHTEQIHNLFN